MNKKRICISMVLMLVVISSMSSCCITGFCPVDNTGEYQSIDKEQQNKLDN